MRDRHARASGVQRYLGNECKSLAGGGLDRPTQGPAVTHQLIEINCNIWDLSDRLVPDGAANGGDGHLQEEVANRRIGRRPLEFDPQRLRQSTMVADAGSLQIPHAPAST